MFISQHLLFQVCSAQRHLLLQLLLLTLMLRLGLHLDLALVGIEQLHLLLQLLPQGLALRFLGLIQTQLTQPTMGGNTGERGTKTQRERSWGRGLHGQGTHKERVERERGKKTQR